MKIHTKLLSEIKIPEGRFREADNATVEKIAQSYLKFGQLQPIIVDYQGNLVDGLHRLTAAQLNGMTEIDCVFVEELDELFLREMELEVNIQRKEMTWLEREKAIAALHKIKVQRDPNWGQAQTQAVVGAARQADVSQAIQLTKMIELFPELEKAKSKNQALSWAKSKAKSMLRVDEVKDNKIDYGFISEKIHLGDSVEFIKTLPDGFINAVITDPPFGINYDNRKSGTAGSLTDYEDSEDSYERLLSMAPDLYRVIKPDGWLIWFMGISWYDRCKTVFRDAGFIVDEIPVIWDRSDGRAFTTRPDRYFGRVYDVALHCIKGNPEIIQRSKPNIIRVAPVGNSERETLVERPVELYAELIRRLTVPGELVADFFVGSGSCPAAAASLGRDFLGCEQNDERRSYAITKIKAHIPESYNAKAR